MRRLVIQAIAANVILGLLVATQIFVQMSAVGELSLAGRIGAAFAMFVMTEAVVGMGFAYRYFLQQRALQGKKRSDEKATAHQERTFEIDLPYDQAFDLANDALKTLDGERVPIPDDPLITLEFPIRRRQHLRIRNTNRQTGIIQAGLRANLMGIKDITDFSEIEIRLQAMDETTTKVHVSSGPNHFLELLDLGKNTHYVNTLSKYLRRESQDHQAAASLNDDSTQWAHPQDATASSNGDRRKVRR
jgi:hypothetical protein